MMGEEASDEAELGNREWPRNENVGVVGDGTSADDVDDVERCRPQPIGTVSDESISVCSFLRASTNNGSFNGLNSRILESEGSTNSQLLERYGHATTV